jgi:hypothetical protein
MRAREFVTEARTGKLGARRQYATRGLNKFRDLEGRDRFYELNRVMMAVAGADGETPISVPGESWTGTFNTAHPYTEVEQKMLQQAYKAVGSEYHDLNDGDFESQELPGTNIESPLKPFKGYPR